MSIRSIGFLLILANGVAGTPALPAPAKIVIERRAKDTVTPVELDVDETVRFQLRNGQVRELTLRSTSATYLWTNVRRLKQAQRDAAGLYVFSADITIDGHPLKLERYVNSQESFYEPMVVNGLRLWLDGVQDIFEFLNENHGECRPQKRARFVLQDARNRICPEKVHLWYPTERLIIPIADSYNGDNAWIGAHKGADAHGGLDINLKRGTPSITPIAFDKQFLFHSIARGDNNNRWRGIRKWDSGDEWTLQVHHLHNLVEPENKPLAGGVVHATNAGTHVGAQYHAHYYFRVQPAGETRTYVLDPWLIFWQAFEDEKRRRGDLLAQFDPPGPAEVGQEVQFNASPSLLGAHEALAEYSWAFSDGGYARGVSVRRAFAKPGVQFATLTIEAGGQKSTRTMHFTVDGKLSPKPSLGLISQEELGFRPRPLSELDIYGMPPARTPGVLRFVARENRPSPNPKRLKLLNQGAGSLEGVRCQQEYQPGGGWLRTRVDGDAVSVTVDSKGVPPGLYKAWVHLESASALTRRTSFRVEMFVPVSLPNHFEHGEDQEVIVDNEDEGFEATPWFWVGGRFAKVPEQGYRNFYLTNGGRAKPGEFARFIPDLMAGEHEVSFVPHTPFQPGTRFDVRVKHARGEEIVSVEPAKSRLIGTFNFAQGSDGWVELLAEGAAGQVLADAVIFRRMPAVWVTK